MEIYKIVSMFPKTKQKIITNTVIILQNTITKISRNNFLRLRD